MIYLILSRGQDKKGEKNGTKRKISLGVIFRWEGFNSNASSHDGTWNED